MSVSHSPSQDSTGFREDSQNGLYRMNAEFQAQ